MKKQLLFATAILLFIVSFTACKKETEANKPLRAKMLGKWQVNKILKSAGTSPTITATDYMDFKDNTNDDFELQLGATRDVGTFSSSIDDSFYLDFPSKDLNCVVTVITPNKFEFTGTVVGSNPKVTETYTLVR